VATFTVWKFHTADGAESALSTLERLQSEELITVQDAAIVTWPEDKKKPKTRHLSDLTGAGALGGAFWGFLFGLIFFVPLLGMAVGAATGALAGSLTHIGIDEGFIKEVREKITPGTSALFVMTSDAVMDKVREAFPAADAELIHTNLSDEDEAALRQAFAEED
jgi:uncharacterized membrane protein